MPSDTAAHTTKDEIEFINYIGTFSESLIATSMPRDMLIQKYASACRKRVYWGNMDRVEVIKHARNLEI